MLKHILLVLLCIRVVICGPAPYVACITACNVVWVGCYAAAGLVAGTITAGIGAPAAALACNAAQGLCMTSCTPMLAVPDPSWFSCSVM